jgi:hypothetical protein
VSPALQQFTRAAIATVQDAVIRAVEMGFEPKEAVDITHSMEGQDADSACYRTLALRVKTVPRGFATRRWKEKVMSSTGWTSGSGR